MKRLTSKILTTATICAMALMLAACGKEDDSPKLPSAQTVTDTPSNNDADAKVNDADNKNVNSNNDADSNNTDNNNADTNNDADNNVPDDSTDNTPDTNETVNGLPEAFTTVTRTSIPEILYTWWNIVGVEVDGVKDDFYSQTAQYQSVMEGYGDLFDFIFSSETEITLQTGENVFTISSGTYTVAGDNMLHIVFDNSEYYAVFTTMAFETKGSKETMVLVNPATPDVILYLWPMDEI